MRCFSKYVLKSWRSVLAGRNIKPSADGNYGKKFLKGCVLSGVMLGTGILMTYGLVWGNEMTAGIGSIISLLIVLITVV